MLHVLYVDRHDMYIVQGAEDEVRDFIGRLKLNDNRRVTVSNHSTYTQAHIYVEEDQEF